MNYKNIEIKITVIGGKGTKGYVASWCVSGSKDFYSDPSKEYAIEIAKKRIDRTLG